MKVTFLGTGTSQGVPVIACQCEVCRSEDPRDKRLRSSILIEKEDFRIVIDCGPDFRQQMLREQVPSIDAILLTHGHKDHTGGLDDVRAFNYVNRMPAQVFATIRVQQAIRREYSYAFDKNPYPGVPEIQFHRLDGKPFNIKDQKIIPVQALHYRDHQYVYGFRIDDFTYITDALLISEKEKKKIIGSKVLVLNALRKKVHYSHLNLDGALALMNELKPEHGYLTHVSHQMGTCASVSRELPDFVEFAYDGLTLVF